MAARGRDPRRHAGSPPALRPLPAEDRGAGRRPQRRRRSPRPSPRLRPAAIRPTAPAEATGETNPCFTGKGSIKEVLDGLRRLSSPRARPTTTSSLPPTATAPRPLGHRNFDAAPSTRWTRPWRSIRSSRIPISCARPPMRRRRTIDKSIADLDEAIRLDASRGDFYMLRGIVFSRRRRSRPAPSSSSTRRSSSIRNRRIGYAKRADSTGRRRTTTAPSPTIPR